MKKYVPLIVASVVIIGFVAYLVMHNPAPVTVLPEEEIPTSISEASTTAPGTTEKGPSGLVARAVATFPGWKISLKFDPSWDVTEQSGTVFISSPTVNFLVNRNQEIGEPAGLEVTSKTRVVAGQTVMVRRFNNPNEDFAFYEYFSLPVGTDTYYFKAKGKTASDADVAVFLGGVTKK